STGAGYVVFGKGDAGTVDLSAVAAGSGGFVMNGAAAGDNAGFAVAGAGDVNGDGLDDLLLGAPFADPAGNGSGAAYLVLGKADTTPVALSAAAASGGLELVGASGDQAGQAVAGAGDVNGDGL